MRIVVIWGDSNVRSELLCFQFRKCFDAKVWSLSSALNVYHLYTVENNVQGQLSPSSSVYHIFIMRTTGSQMLKTHSAPALYLTISILPFKVAITSTCSCYHAFLTHLPAYTTVQRFGVGNIIINMNVFF